MQLSTPGSAMELGSWAQNPKGYAAWFTGLSQIQGPGPILSAWSLRPPCKASRPHGAGLPWPQSQPQLVWDALLDQPPLLPSLEILWDPSGVPSVHPPPAHLSMYAPSQPPAGQCRASPLQPEIP